MARALTEIDLMNYSDKIESRTEFYIRINNLMKIGFNLGATNIAVPCTYRIAGRCAWGGSTLGNLIFLNSYKELYKISNIRVL